MVVLLHGFPEFWYAWHKQIEPLAAAGFRVIVPDQRGYSLSSKPTGVGSYALTELVSDVISIADQLGEQKIFLAGHDWGAAVAWSATLLPPQRTAHRQTRRPQRPAPFRHAPIPVNSPSAVAAELVHVFLPDPLAAGGNLLRIPLLHRYARPSSLQPARHILGRGSRPISCRVVATRCAHRHDQLVSRSFPSSREISRPHRPRSYAHPVGRARRLSSLGYGSRELFTFADATHWLQHEQSAKVSQMLVEFFRS